MKNSHRDSHWSRMANFTYGARPDSLRVAAHLPRLCTRPHVGPSPPASCATSPPPRLSVCGATAQVVVAEQRARDKVQNAEATERQRLVARRTHDRPRAAPTASSSLDDDTAHTACPVRRADDAHIAALLSAHRYAQAYLALSTSLARDEERVSGDDHDDGRALWRRAVLYGRRALCSDRLMNYAECVEDCQASLHYAAAGARRRGDVDDGKAWDALEVGDRLVMALVMREDYAAAGALLRRLLGPDAAPCAALRGRTPHSELRHARWAAQLRSLPAVERFRACVTQERWPEARQSMADAAPFVADGPLCTLHALTLLECGDAAAARTALAAYVATLNPPHVAALELRQLQAQTRSHYVQAAVLLAKASAYCGRPFMDVAAVLVRRCLLLQPCYGPAVTLGNYLVTLEHFYERAEELLAQGCYDDLLAVVDDAVRLDDANTRVRVHFELLRAEAHLALRKPFAAIEDCTRCIAAEKDSARAFYLRARAYRLVGRHAEAAADGTRAVELQPSYAARALENEPPETTKPTPPVHTATTTVVSRTLYDVLGVPRTAPHAQIRARFKQLTLRFHPDRHVCDSSEVQRSAAEVFKQVNHAHAILADPQRRAAYDASLPKV